MNADPGYRPELLLAETAWLRGQDHVAIVTDAGVVFGSPHRGETTYELVEELLRGLADDPARDRGELEKLVATARAVAAQK